MLERVLRSAARPTASLRLADLRFWQALTFVPKVPAFELLRKTLAAAGCKSVPRPALRCVRRFANTGSCKNVSRSGSKTAAQPEMGQALRGTIIPYPSPFVKRARSMFCGESWRHTWRRQHRASLAAFNRAEAYYDTLKSGTGEKTSEVLARDVAGTLNYLDIIGDS